VLILIGYIIWLLSFIILPIFQGGYFYHEALLFGVVQGSVFLVLAFNNKLVIPKSKILLLYGIIVVSGIFSSVSAVNLGIHVIGLLKITVPLIWLINLGSFWHIYKEKMMKQTRTAFVVSALAISLISLVVLVFVSDESELFMHFIQKERFGGFFQYANTYGIYIFGSLILLFIGKYKVLYKILGGILLMSNIILTQSRGVIIIGLAVMFVIIVMMKSYRYIIGIIVGGLFIGQGVLMIFLERIQLYRSINISGNSSEWLSRILYYEDGLKILIDNITGIGHGGYYDIHRYYQTGAAYKVRYIHNSLLQIGIDYGVMAMFALLGIGLLSLIILYNNKKLWWNQEYILYTLGGLALFGHSIIDFDFQFMSFTIIFLFMVYSAELVSDKVKGVYIFGGDKVIYKWCIIIILLCITVSMLFFARITLLEYNGEQDKSYNSYPYFTTSVIGILNDESSDYTQEQKTEIALNAVKRNEFFVPGFAFLRDYYYNSGDLENAIIYSVKVYQLAPLRLDYFEIYTKIAWEHILNLYKSGELQGDNNHLKDLTNIARHIKELENDRKNNYNIKHKVEFKMTENMIQVLEKATYLYNKLN